MPIAIAAAESLGFGPFAQTVPNPTHHFFGSGRIFHDLANGDQFWIGYSYEHRSSDNSERRRHDSAQRSHRHAISGT